MKTGNNNLFKYIFAVAFIALVVGSIYIVYYSNNKQSEIDSSEEETSENENLNISVVEQLKLGISNFDTINPLLTHNREVIYIDKLIFDPLVNITSDYRAELCLAKSIEKTSDTTYTIKVDTNIKWQDGSTLIAKDVDYTIRKLKEINSIYSSNVEYVQGIVTPDSETIELTLSKEIPFFEYNLSFPILSSGYYMNEDFENSSKIPIGTGMYKIASIDDDNILLIRNDRWRKLKTNTPMTQSISIHKFSSIGEIFNGFKMGNIDLVNTYMTNYENYVGIMGYNKKEYKGKDFDFISLNCEDILLSDSGVRRAISYGINKDDLVGNIFANQKVVSHNVLDYGSYLYNGEGVATGNQDEAKKCLEEAGWVYTSNRWQKSIGGHVRKLTLNLIVNENNQDRIRVSENIKNQLEKIGVIVNVAKVNDEKYYDYLNNKSYQMIITGISDSINPSLDYFFGEGNLANYNNDSVKSNVYNLESFGDIQKVTNEDCPYIGLYRNKGTMLLNANVGGEFEINNFNVYNNFNKWYRQQ